MKSRKSHPFRLSPTCSVSLIAAVVVATVCCSGASDADLKQILSLLGTLRTGDDYAAVQKVLPGIGPLHADAGEDNTEAITQKKIGPVTIKGEFNFAHGGLVSHGFDTGKITHAQAHDLFVRCAELLVELYGPAERSFELPSEHDGPRDALDIEMHWRLNGEQFGITLEYKTETASVSWGAQSESPN